MSPIFLILAIDELMDMVRTSVNVIGNCLATYVIAKCEGEFGLQPADSLSLAAHDFEPTRSFQESITSKKIHV